MGVMSEIDSLIQQAIAPEPGTPEQMIEERVARLADEMVDLAILAMDPEQKPLIEREWRSIAQILLRAQLILSTLKGEDVETVCRLIAALDYAKKPSGLRIVR